MADGVCDRVPIEQLQGHGVSVVMGNQIQSLVAQTQMSHQGFHNTGLLENGVLVGSLWVQKWNVDQCHSCRLM